MRSRRSLAASFYKRLNWAGVNKRFRWLRCTSPLAALLLLVVAGVFPEPLCSFTTDGSGAQGSNRT